MQIFIGILSVIHNFSDIYNRNDVRVKPGVVSPET